MSNLYVYLSISIVKGESKMRLTNSSDDFPALCEDCCGPDKHIKMIRQPGGEECKICTRPFTVYRWNPSNARHKSRKTIICMTCARTRNCCQSCMLDIHFRIPLEIRDTALKLAGLDKAYSFTNKSLNSSNREVKAIAADKEESKFNGRDENGDVNDMDKAKEILLKLAEKLHDDDKATKKITNSRKQNETGDIKSSDVSKILAKLPFGGLFVVPEDKSITSFFIFGFDEELPQYAITNYCIQFGKIRTMTILHRARCGYIGFISRDSAVAFSQSISGNGLNANNNTPGLLVLNKRFPIRVSWGKAKPLGTTNEEHYKIGLVVKKVMKQLAEKDRNYLLKQSKLLDSGVPIQAEKAKSLKKLVQGDSSAPIVEEHLSKSKYKSLLDDFEL
ncbi:uncharacterized protein PRCAT00004721001 [Priceomyces carsonii]|uniref:uncharacterized protein n=1 Tax=Priceomyces carsonii TaxID=28549 RepID=UPI002ED82BF6|nr:unnamed protein product [Priceomyces carsonii]